MIMYMECDNVYHIYEIFYNAMYVDKLIYATYWYKMKDAV